MKKAWKPMQVKFVGQVREVVQFGGGKYSPKGKEAMRFGRGER